MVTSDDPPTTLPTPKIKLNKKQANLFIRKVIKLFVFERKPSINKVAVLGKLYFQYGRRFQQLKTQNNFVCTRNYRNLCPVWGVSLSNRFGFFLLFAFPLFQPEKIAKRMWIVDVVLDRGVGQLMRVPFVGFCLCLMGVKRPFKPFQTMAQSIRRGKYCILYQTRGTSTASMSISSCHFFLDCL